MLPNPLLAVSAISRHADFRVLYNGSALQSGTGSCEIVYNGSRPYPEPMHGSIQSIELQQGPGSELGKFLANL
jgi:hypothetical protein